VLEKFVFFVVFIGISSVLNSFGPAVMAGSAAAANSKSLD